MIATEPILAGIADLAPEFVEIRRRIHAHPELAFEETGTSELVAGLLAQWGYEVHRGIGRTGLVGVLRAGDGRRTLGLRADMDALPIHEATGLPYASRRAGLQLTYTNSLFQLRGIYDEARDPANGKLDDVFNYSREYFAG
ncbi:hypothetical protein PPH41_27940, partial [Burkholderia gladioli]|nr:hypothetical protein [Burkholderia gladioli]